MKKGRSEEAPNASVSEAPKLHWGRFSYTNPHTSTHGRFHPSCKAKPHRDQQPANDDTRHLLRHRHVLDLSGIASRAGYSVGVEELKVVAYRHWSFSWRGNERNAKGDTNEKDKVKKDKSERWPSAHVPRTKTMVPSPMTTFT